MADENERIAKALESLVILVDEIRAQMVMEKQDDVDERKRAAVEYAQATLKNRPGAMKFLQAHHAKGPLRIEILNVLTRDGDVKFTGLIDGDLAPGKQIEGIIKDVY